MKRLASFVVPLAGVLTIFASLASADVSETFERVVPFSTGGSFSIENGNGSITVRTWNEGSVRIEAEKRAETREHLEDIEIDITGSGDSVSVETIHHRRRERGNVSYVISIPREADIDVSTANGAVTIEGIHGRVVAHSTNGNLKVEDISGEIEATTTNGSIRAVYSNATDGTHRFKTVNGSVRVYLPENAGGDLEAETVNGSIDIDFPTTLRRINRRHLRGSFGTGGGSFDIETVNGSVKILAN